MTTYVDFVPTAISQFQFNATLDDGSYVISCGWNVFGQRWYVTCSTQNGQTVFTLPLIASDGGIAVDAMTYDFGLVTATTVTPHGYPIGSVVPVIISGSSPTGYNGSFDVTALSPIEFSYVLAVDPGPLTAPGSVLNDINIAGGYFTNSTLVFREPTMQFEINP